jgi:hypothetical protein
MVIVGCNKLKNVESTAWDTSNQRTAFTCISVEYSYVQKWASEHITVTGRRPTS